MLDVSIANQILYEYKGCYQDKDLNRDLDKEMIDFDEYMSLEICISFCILKNHRYVGLQGFDKISYILELK